MVIRIFIQRHRFISGNIVLNAVVPVVIVYYVTLYARIYLHSKPGKIIHEYMNVFMQHTARQPLTIYFIVKVQSNVVLFIPSVLKIVGVKLYFVSVIGTAFHVKCCSKCAWRRITYTKSDFLSEFPVPGCLKSRNPVLDQVYRMRLNNIYYEIQKLFQVILADIKTCSVITGFFQFFRQ